MPALLPDHVLHLLVVNHKRPAVENLAGKVVAAAGESTESGFTPACAHNCIKLSSSPGTEQSVSPRPRQSRKRIILLSVGSSSFSFRD